MFAGVLLMKMFVSVQMLLLDLTQSVLLTNIKPQPTTSLTAPSCKTDADMHLNIFIESCTSEMALFTL